MAIAKLRITWLLSWDAESIWRSASIHFPTLMLSVDSSIATETVVAACTSPPAGGKGFSTFRWGGTSKAYRRRVWQQSKEALARQNTAGTGRGTRTYLILK